MQPNISKDWSVNHNLWKTELLRERLASAIIAFFICVVCADRLGAAFFSYSGVLLFLFSFSFALPMINCLYLLFASHCPWELPVLKNTWNLIDITSRIATRHVGFRCVSDPPPLQLTQCFSEMPPLPSPLRSIFTKSATPIQILRNIYL